MKLEPYLPDDILRALDTGSSEMEELAGKMLRAAAVPLKDALSDKVGRHSRTGALARSPKIGRPRHKPQYDAYVIDVTFGGTDKDKHQNKIKAKAIQYGWHNETPDPFLQEAQAACEGRVSEILQTVYQQECSLIK